MAVDLGASGGCADHCCGNLPGLVALAGEFGASYAVPIIDVPPLVITHVVAFYLFARPQPGTARGLAGDVPAT